VPVCSKYTHAAVFPLVLGCEAGSPTPSAAAGSSRILPLCAMVCNFTKPTPTAPSLLRHEEVVTLCEFRREGGDEARMHPNVMALTRVRGVCAVHEFGHVTHCLCSVTRCHRFSSFNCEMDFVEAPSQMLEASGCVGVW